MKQKAKRPKSENLLVWERSEPVARPAPEPLSRASILQAALSIADQEGLASVSYRKIAASLNAGPMRLYTYFSTKEELLEFMVDAVFGEMISQEKAPVDWRQGIRSIALRTRSAALKHPWLADLLGGRPHQGPNALVYLEEALACFNKNSGFQSIDSILLASKTVNAYVLGAIRNELSEQRAETETGLDEKGWQAATEPYIRRVIATGRFPMLEKVVRDATDPTLEEVFVQGLESVLDGIQVRLLKN